MLRVGAECDERSILLGNNAGHDDVAVDTQRLAAAIDADHANSVARRCQRSVNSR
jgi:hypothetical protein